MGLSFEPALWCWLILSFFTQTGLCDPAAAVGLPLTSDGASLVGGVLSCPSEPQLQLTWTKQTVVVSFSWTFLINHEILPFIHSHSNPLCSAYTSHPGMASSFPSSFWFCLCLVLFTLFLSYLDWSICYFASLFWGLLWNIPSLGSTVLLLLTGFFIS